MDMQVSLHGKRSFLTRANHYTGDDFLGPLIGKYGIPGSDQMTAPALWQSSLLEDDFLGAAIHPALWTLAKGSDGGCANFAVLAGQINGVARGTTGAGAGATMAVNGVEMTAGLNFQANKGGFSGGSLGVAGSLIVELSVKPSAITTICMFFGLTNSLSLQMPFTNSADVITANAADAVGFLFDTAATTQRTNLVGVNNSGTPQQTILPTTAPSSGAPDTAAFHRYRLELNASGDTDFYIDGTVVGSRMLAACRPNQPLTPCIAAFTRAAGSANMDVDWAYLIQGR